MSLNTGLPQTLDTHTDRQSQTQTITTGCAGVTGHPDGSHRNWFDRVTTATIDTSQKAMNVSRYSIAWA